MRTAKQGPSPATKPIAEPSALIDDRAREHLAAFKRLWGEASSQDRAYLALRAEMHLADLVTMRLAAMLDHASRDERDVIMDWIGTRDRHHEAVFELGRRLVKKFRPRN